MNAEKIPTAWNVPAAAAAAGSRMNSPAGSASLMNPIQCCFYSPTHYWRAQASAAYVADRQACVSFTEGGGVAHKRLQLENIER